MSAVKGERRAPAQVLVFKGTGDSPHFCTGMDLKAATFGDDTMSLGLEEFARLHQVSAGWQFVIFINRIGISGKPLTNTDKSFNFFNVIKEQLNVFFFFL